MISGAGDRLAYHCAFSCGGAKFHDVEYEGYVDTVPYGCWRKSTLERIGLFDESLSRNQDDELTCGSSLPAGGFGSHRGSPPGIGPEPL